MTASSSPTDTLNALHVSQLQFSGQKGWWHLEFARSVLWYVLSPWHWRPVPIHSKVHSIWIQSHPILALPCALLWLSWMVHEAPWRFKLFITKKYWSVKLRTSEVHSSSPLLLCLTYWGTVRKLLWCWLSTCLLVQNKLIKAQAQGGGGIWMSSTGSIIHLIRWEYLFWR